MNAALWEKIERLNHLHFLRGVVTYEGGALETRIEKERETAKNVDGSNNREQMEAYLAHKVAPLQKRADEYNRARDENEAKIAAAETELRAMLEE